MINVTDYEIGNTRASGVGAYWQTRPCPSWCTTTSRHRDTDHVEDRYHYAPPYRIPLRAAHPVEHGDAKYPPFCEIEMDQHEGAVEPVITIGWQRFRLAEADALMGIVGHLVAQARGDVDRPGDGGGQVPPAAPCVCG